MARSGVPEPGSEGHQGPEPGRILGPRASWEALGGSKSSI